MRQRLLSKKSQHGQLVYLFQLAKLGEIAIAQFAKLSDKVAILSHKILASAPKEQIHLGFIIDAIIKNLTSNFGVALATLNMHQNRGRCGVSYCACRYHTGDIATFFCRL